MNDEAEAPLIRMQMNEQGKKDGFAFTMVLPAVPRVSELVYIGGRKFVIVDVEWHPLTPWPIHLIALER
jgi:hypothetical protein